MLLELDTTVWPFLGHKKNSTSPHFFFLKFKVGTSFTLLFVIIGLYIYVFHISFPFLLMLVDIYSFIWKCVCIICHWHNIGYMYHMRTRFLEMNMRYVSCLRKMHKTRAWPLSLEFEIILRRRYVLKWECESKRLMNWTTWELWEVWNLARNA